MPDQKKQAKGGQLVTFLLGRETYGIDIFQIQEVVHFQEIISIPGAPEFIEGIIKLRDRVIPVIDLKKRLGIRGQGTGKRRIMILDMAGRPLGLIVDDIAKVLMVDESKYEALPDYLVLDPEKDCISRLAKIDQELVIIISPDRILSNPERQSLENIDPMPGGEAYAQSPN